MIGVAGLTLIEQAQALCTQARIGGAFVPYVDLDASTDRLSKFNHTWFGGTRFRIDPHPTVHSAYLVQYWQRRAWYVKHAVLGFRLLRSYLQVSHARYVKCGPGPVRNIAQSVTVEPDSVSPLGLPWEIARLEDPIALEAAVEAWVACGNTLLFEQEGDAS